MNTCLNRLESDPPRVKSLVGREWIKRDIAHISSMRCHKRCRRAEKR